MRDDHFAVRTHALRLAEAWVDGRPALLERALGLIGDPDPLVRLQLALTLGESRDERALEALARLAARHGGERWVDAAIMSSAAGSAGRLLAALLRSGGAGKSGDAGKGSALLAPLASSVASHRDPDESALVLEAVSALGGEGAAPLQVACLSAFKAGLKRGAERSLGSPAAQRALRRLLEGPSAEVRRLAFELAGSLGLAEAPEVKEVFARAGLQALDGALSLEERRAATGLLSSAPYPVLAPVATAVLDPRQPPELQLAAVEALSSSEDSGVAAVLLEGWAGHSPRVQAAVIDALFGRQNRLPVLLEVIRGDEVEPASLDGFRPLLLRTVRSCGDGNLFYAQPGEHRFRFSIKAHAESMRFGEEQDCPLLPFPAEGDPFLPS
ncbi:MAG: HEAT repeat domain-containing protein [Planctomycetes bacterium]|nr:HEAT repeat domain-containing protein [Planctomycetota bacterium]